MKIKSIKLKNFARYAKIEADFEKDVTYLIGPNGSGKSTLGLNSIWFMFQGIATRAMNGKTPLIGERFRFIGDNTGHAKGEMILYDEKTSQEIKVKRTLTKKSNEVTFEAPEDSELKLNQKWLDDLFNVFLISPKLFMQLEGREQAEKLGIDVSKYDKKLKELKSEYTLINRDIRNFGELVEPEKVERIDIDNLLNDKERIRKELNQEYLRRKESNEKLRKEHQIKTEEAKEEIKKHNLYCDRQRQKVEKGKEYIKNIKSALNDFSECFEKQIPSAKTTLLECEDVVKQIKFDDYKEFNVLPEPDYFNEMPDDSKLKEIDEKISNAAQINEKAGKYESFLKEKDKREGLLQALELNKNMQKEQIKARTDYLRGKKLPFANLTIDESGQLLLSNRPLKEQYFSTGELIKIIPVLMSSQNPDLKYVFIQDFNLLDEDKQNEIENYLVQKGMQLVIEYVSRDKKQGKNCILLKDMKIINEH